MAADGDGTAMGGVERASAATAEAAYRMFKGYAHASFCGEVKEADLRGEVLRVRLVIGDGPSELDCICTADQVELIRVALNRRVRVSGRAYYNGASGLPHRLEVRIVEPVKAPADFTRWRGAFEPFEATEWLDEY